MGRIHGLWGSILESSRILIYHRVGLDSVWEQAWENLPGDFSTDVIIKEIALSKLIKTKLRVCVCVFVGGRWIYEHIPTHKH